MSNKHIAIIGIAVLFCLILPTPVGDLFVNKSSESTITLTTENQEYTSEFTTDIYAIKNDSLSSNVTSDLTIETYDHDVVSSFLNFSNLQSYGINLTVEDDTNNGTQAIKPGAYMQFIVPGDALLKNFSVYLDIGAPHDANWVIYNASWNATYGEKPDQAISASGTILSTGYTWHNVTGVNVSLLVSNTINNTFFLELNTGTSVNWDYVFDNSTGDGVDEGHAWYKDPFLNPVDFDFLLRYIGLEPYDSTPTPTAVGLAVNSTAVDPDGEWFDDILQLQKSSMFYDVSADWNLSFTVTSQLNLSTTFSGNRTALAEPNLVYWNLTLNTTLEPTLFNGNFSIPTPTDWNFNGVYNSSLPFSDYILESNKIKVFWVQGNGNWTIVYTAPNYLESTTLSPYPNATITTNVSITALFNATVTPTQEKGYLKINNATGDQIFESNTSVANEMLNFSWIPSGSI
ncbi:MAG: hypothetical protein ACW976_02520, partial [Candidatus Ranarchaeia archaeon]